MYRTYVSATLLIHSFHYDNRKIDPYNSWYENPLMFDKSCYRPVIPSSILKKIKRSIVYFISLAYIASLTDF